VLADDGFHFRPNHAGLLAGFDAEFYQPKLGLVRDIGRTSLDDDRTADRLECRDRLGAGSGANRALAGDWKGAYTYALKTVATRNDLEASLLFIDFMRYHETEALLRGGDEERAREEVQRLGANIRTNRRLRLSYLRSQATLAQWDKELEEAIASLQEAAVLASEIGLPGELWQVQVALGDVYTLCGEREQASQAFARARASVEELAEKMGDEALRMSFLAEPVVRRVWDRQ